MTMLSDEQERRAMFCKLTGRVATIATAEYFAFCKGIDAVRAELAKQEPVATVVRGVNGTTSVTGVMILDMPHGAKLYADPVVPDGYVMVPVEPTEKMLYSGLKAALDVGFSVTTTVRQEIYRAMIAAAQESNARLSLRTRDDETGMLCGERRNDEQQRTTQDS